MASSILIGVVAGFFTYYFLEFVDWVVGKRTGRSIKERLIDWVDRRAGWLVAWIQKK